MNINLSVFLNIIFGLAIIMAVLGYYLGRRKTQTPKLTALVAVLTAVIPPVALLFLIALLLKNDIKAKDIA